MLGGVNKENAGTNSVYSCSLSSLLFSIGSKSQKERLVNTVARSSKGSIWNRVTNLSVERSTAVTLHGQLLAIGGRDSEGKPTAAVHMYQPTTNTWEVISHMTIPRSECLAAVLPDNQHIVYVVGGWTTARTLCNLVEFGRVIHLP